MDDWKHIKIAGVSKIDKCVGEFDVWAIGKVPYAKFKVKIFEDTNGTYTGYSNVRLKNLKDNSPEGEAGFGSTISEALENTIQLFLGAVDIQIENRGRALTGDDIEYSDPSDF